MKNQSFLIRLGYALHGLGVAVRGENSFRFHVLAAVAVAIALVWFRPAPVWWGVIALTVAVVLAAELFNTALEHLADHLHPDQHPEIKIVKDCAAAAVLIATIGAIAVAVAFVFSLRG
jgi:undecaprenol kinase